MSSQTQTAIAMTAIGKPLQPIPFPVPTPKDGEILVKVTVAGLIPLDHKIRDHDILGFSSRLPAVLAFDVVGTVVSNGPNSSLPIGAHIFSQSNFNNIQGGALQEYTTLPAIWAREVPSNISDAEASTFPINSFTSGLSLFGQKGLQIPLPGTAEAKNTDYAALKLVIIGGGTNCGKFAIQYAKIAGIGQIITTASLSGAEELKSYGATHVIDRKAADIKEQIRAIVGDELVYVYDTFNSGDHTLAVSLLSNSKKGTLVRLLPGPTTVEKTVEDAKQQGWEDKAAFGAPLGSPEFAGVFLGTLTDWVKKGLVKPSKFNLVDGFNAEKINKAIDNLRDGLSAKPAIKF